jgi:tetratricopeptide (TPR) repeat protein
MARRALRVPITLLFAISCAVTIGGAATAWADSSPPSDAPPAADGERVRQLFEVVIAGPTADRQAAIDELLTLGPRAIPAIQEFLARERDESDANRRAVLARIHASVPDEDGRFQSPGRQTAQQIRDDDAFDWLPELFALREMPGLGSVIADVAAVRALATTESYRAAGVILDFAFSADGLVIRDECGRYLRKMAPHSLPALIRGAGDRRQAAAKRRYARYQLGRLDREDAPKALTAAGGEDLQVAILRAYGDTQWREAVHSVLDLIDYEAPPVRLAAREAWLSYVTGEPPPPAPKRKLDLPGGRQSDEPEQLYNNARELADFALRRRYAEVLGQRPPAAASLGELSQALFDHHDEARHARLEASFEEALETVQAGDLDAALAEFDRILVQDPDFSRRAEMVDAYMAKGIEQREAGAYREATTAFAKAYMLAPEGARADEARGAQRQARALTLAEATGDPEALEAVPPPPPSGPPGEVERPWLLFGGIGVGLMAVVLGVIGVAARRRQSSGV